MWRLEYIYGMETVWFDNFCVWNSPASSATEQATAADIVIFPNTSGSRRIIIEHKNGLTLDRFSLFDLSGRRVLLVSQIGAPQYQLDYRDLPAGAYILQVECAGLLTAHKVILL